MRAALVRKFGGPEAVEIAEVPLPEPGPGQVRVKVAAAALNPVDAGVRAGVFGGQGPLGLGWDVAGTIDALGPDATGSSGALGSDAARSSGALGSGPAGWAVGDLVVGLAYGPHKPLGTHADYVVLDASALAAAPRSADAVDAATLPLNALAAAQALDLLALAPGDRLLVTGAAGALGGYAVQLGRLRGLEVTAMAGDADEELVRALGAGGFVARTARPEPVDGVLDAAVIGTPALAFARDGGAYAAVIPNAVPAPERGVRTGGIEVKPDGARLAELVHLVERGHLALRVAGTHPLEEAEHAHARLAAGGLRGRLVLLP
ncbi:NADP-dependent oxidoreductase [Nonomuraea typhae]|uniref:NADP-dependent oxidoreductase n=1 Tax=Nonomuraea typhae TaxID=2603600 RepID=UPI0012F929F3|nr:NADP-dependent oxidoreductase [Nonomuraea typhae]